MAEGVCPFWVGYFLINPLRKLIENPHKLMGRFVQKGMTVLEPGCGMGYFTLPLARMAGPAGRVVAVDVQPRMLEVLRRRAQKAGISGIIEAREAGEDSLGVEDLAGSVDFAAALHVAHEVPDQEAFFAELGEALKTGARLLFIEPRGHVSREDFEQSLKVAENLGFKAEADYEKILARVAVLVKGDA